jgi:hypothetical protein
MIMPRLFNLVAYGIGVPLMMTEGRTTKFGSFQKIAIAIEISPSLLCNDRSDINLDLFNNRFRINHQIDL